MGVGATKKWERIESYGPKFVENIVQGISRDLLCYAMRTLRCCDNPLIWYPYSRSAIQFLRSGLWRNL